MKERGAQCCVYAGDREPHNLCCALKCNQFWALLRADYSAKLGTSIGFYFNEEALYIRESALEFEEDHLCKCKIVYNSERKD